MAFVQVLLLPRSTPDPATPEHDVRERRLLPANTEAVEEETPCQRSSPYAQLRATVREESSQSKQQVDERILYSDRESNWERLTNGSGDAIGVTGLGWPFSPLNINDKYTQCTVCHIITC